jgi:cyclophilin family peptidyl-prolyl cis-trans isomerase
MRSLLAAALSLLLTSLPATAQAPAKAPKGKPVNITMETSLGSIKLELDAAKAPDTVANFVQYAKAGHFDGLVFHRVIKGFMIQGGGYDESFKQRATRAPVKNEAKNGLKNARGTVAMARTSDPHSATSQFFINHKDNDFLDFPGQDGWGYTVFGKVTEGMDVVDKIAATPTGPTAPFGRDVPVKAVVMKKVTVVEPK